MNIRVVVENQKNSRSVFEGQVEMCMSLEAASAYADRLFNCLVKEWLQYADWEVSLLSGTFVCLYNNIFHVKVSQNEFARSCSVFERALDLDPHSIRLWLSYTQMELKSRNVQHSRNFLIEPSLPRAKGTPCSCYWCGSCEEAIKFRLD